MLEVFITFEVETYFFSSEYVAHIYFCTTWLKIHNELCGCFEDIPKNESPKLKQGVKKSSSLNELLGNSRIIESFGTTHRLFYRSAIQLL